MSTAAPRVLVVDDRPDKRYLLAHQLRAEGFLVDEAGAGSEALSLAEAQRPDLIVLDVRMPVMDGFEVLSRLKDNPVTRDIPVLQVSATFIETDERVRGLNGGAASVLSLPQAPELLATVRMLLRAREVERERERLLSAERSARVQANMMAERFRSLVAASSQVVWTTNAAGEMVEESASWRAFTGQALADAHGEGWLDVIHPEDRTRIAAAWRDSVHASRPLEVEYRLRKLGGGYADVLVRGVPVFAGQAQVQEWIGTCTDISVQKEKERELRVQASVERQLVGIVSHDLRNPLNVIMLSASLLLRRPSTDERSRRDAARIVSNTERAVRLIRDLLDFTQARLGAGIPIEPKPGDLHELLREAVEDCRQMHPGREIVLSLEGDGRAVLDPDRISQLVENLLSNALKYSPADTKVTVRGAVRDQHCQLSVHNWGVPIADGLRARLFQPLQRGDRTVNSAGRSLGLGLFIVASIVRAHEGTVDVTSDERDGTCFTVSLPKQTLESTGRRERS